MILDPALEPKLRQLLIVFLEENKKLNLSALRTEDACWTGNVLDSVAGVEVMKKECGEGAGGEGPVHQKQLLDLGTGGGFPLLPLAIALPNLHCTGLDSVGKKIEAVKRIIGALELKNATAIAGRAEELGHQSAHREHYDIVTSRAVAPLNILLEYASAFVKVNGIIVLWKSLHIDDELKESERAQEQLLCPLETTYTYSLDEDWLASPPPLLVGLPAVAQRLCKKNSKQSPEDYGGQPTLREGWGERQLLIFRKKGPMGRAYPRKVGEAKRKPL